MILKDKKGVTWQIILMGIICLAALVIVVSVTLTEGGFLGKTKAAVKGTLTKMTPNKTLEEMGQPSMVTEVGAAGAIENLKKTIEEILNSKTRNCFANYGGFPEFKEKGTSINFVYDINSDTTTMIVLGGAGGKQLAKKYTFPGMIPCVIAGSETITTNFFNHFIEKKSLTQPYYKLVKNLKIAYETEHQDSDNKVKRAWGCINANAIRIPEFAKDVVNDQCDNIEDGGFLFSPDNKHICFFATIYGTFKDHDEDGIDDDYISGEEEKGVKKRFNQNKLRKCSG